MEAESPLKSWFCPHQNRRSSWCFVSPRPQAAGCRVQGLCTGRDALPRASCQAQAPVTQVASSCL